MVKRAINKKIVIRAKEQAPKGLNILATDKALAACLGVTYQTVGTWRREGTIPFKYVPGTKTPLYNVKQVLKALENYKQQ